MLRKQLIWQDCEWHLTLLPLIFASENEGEEKGGNIKRLYKHIEKKKLMMVITYILLVYEFSIN
jgi:hypothetical protein